VVNTMFETDAYFDRTQLNWVALGAEREKTAEEEERRRGGPRVVCTRKKPNLANGE
jgi:hypothetical protein